MGSRTRWSAAREAPHETIVERAARAIEQAGFCPVGIEAEHTDAARSGFVLRPRRDGCAEIRWIGLRDVDAWPRRRASLTGYAGVLRQAGLNVQYVADESEPYLVCWRAARTTQLCPYKQA